MKLRLSALMLLLLCLLPHSALCGETYFDMNSPDATTDDRNIYVAEYGDDNQSGSLEAPLKTFRAALSRALGTQSTGIITIWLRGGTYPIEQTIVASQTDQPSYERLIIRAYGDETPVLTGSITLEDWTETTLNGVTVWSTPYTSGTLRALYGEDGARQPSRWPKSGTLPVREAYEQTETKLEGSFAFYVNRGDLPVSLDGSFLRLLHWWKDELIGIKGYSASSGLLLLNRPTSMAITSGDRYWLENVPGIPLVPGEWQHDQTNQMIFYAPRDGESIWQTKLYAGAVEELIVLLGVSNIEFNGITFARTGWSIPNNDSVADFAQAAYDAGYAILAANAQDIRFINCTFRDIGSGCIRLDAAIKGAIVSGCTFENIGAQAVYVHGQNMPAAPAITESITIENNLVSGYGRNFLNAAAILIIHARNVDVLHNEIHDGTYTAISAGWVWGSGFNITQSIRIRNNLIYNIGQGKLSDMGAIYLLGSQPGTIVSGNIIHDVVSADYGGWGIYLDEGSSQIQVTQNLVYRCSAQGFHQHSGVENTVENNIFALNTQGQIGLSGKGIINLRRNIIVGSPPHVRKEGDGTINYTDNVIRTDLSLFVSAANENFNVVTDAEIAASGFIPWVFFAGRYTALQQSVFSTSP